MGKDKMNSEDNEPVTLFQLFCFGVMMFIGHWLYHWLAV